jgi:hypothetical protein
MRNPFTLIRSLLRWLGAFDESVLTRCKTEGMRATATGALVVVVSGLAAASATLTGQLFLDMRPLPSLLFGLCWGAAIMTFDRWLLLVIKRQRTNLGTLALAAPRVLLAVVAGYVIATSLVLLAFHFEVTRQAEWDKQQSVQSHLTAIETADDPAINSLTNTEDHLEAEIGTTVDQASVLNSDPLYQADRLQATELTTKAEDANAAAICELDGTCGTHAVGAGPIYDRKLAYANSLHAQAVAAENAAQARAAVLIKEESAATTQQHADEQHQLTGVQSQLAELEGARANAEKTVHVEYGGPVGLADRLEALAVLEGIYPSVRFYSYMLTFLLMLIDASPAVGKALLLVGLKAPYEEELEAEEQANRKAAQIPREARCRVAQMAAQETIDQAIIHREQWRDALPDLIARIVEVQRRTTEDVIRDWERRIRAQVEDDASVAPPPPPQQDVRFEKSA